MNRPIVLGLTHRLVCFDERIPAWYGPNGPPLDICASCGDEDLLYSMSVDKWRNPVCWHCADNYYLNCPHCGYMYPEKDLLVIDTKSVLYDDGVVQAWMTEIFCPGCAYKALGITLPSSQLMLSAGDDNAPCFICCPYDTSYCYSDEQQCGDCPGVWPWGDASSRR